MVDLPAWTASRKDILDYLAGMPSFHAQRGAAADLARAQESESFLFLLNGWNEIAESNSVEAVDALRDLERAFPKAGIIVATRTHHLTPPLPGALRLRLLRLRRQQRADYLSARLGAKAAELRELLDAEPSLDDLTLAVHPVSGRLAIRGRGSDSRHESRRAYPETAFRFEHQQFQEHYAALDLRARLLDLRNGDADAQRRFTADYVNEPAGPSRYA